jgi:hypothetical protein
MLVHAALASLRVSDECPSHPLPLALLADGVPEDAWDGQAASSTHRGGGSQHRALAVEPAGVEPVAARPSAARAHTFCRRCRSASGRSSHIRPHRLEIGLTVLYGLIMLAVCALACVVPTHRALRVDPTLGRYRPGKETCRCQSDQDASDRNAESHLEERAKEDGPLVPLAPLDVRLTIIVAHCQPADPNADRAAAIQDLIDKRRRMSGQTSCRSSSTGDPSRVCAPRSADADFPGATRDGKGRHRIDRGEHPDAELDV